MIRLSLVLAALACGGSSPRPSPAVTPPPVVVVAPLPCVIRHEGAPSDLGEMQVGETVQLAMRADTTFEAGCTVIRQSVVRAPAAPRAVAQPRATAVVPQSCLTLTIATTHVARVIDGDTFTLHHVGVPTEERVRVLGVNSPEPGKPGFSEARMFTQNWLASGPFTLNSCRRDSFGRLLGTVTRHGVSLADALIAAGHGVRA